MIYTIQLVDLSNIEGNDQIKCWCAEDSKYKINYDHIQQDGRVSW